MNTVKKLSKTTLSFALQILAAALCGLILLSAVYAIPEAPMQAHMAASADILMAEGVYPEVYGWCTSQLDNYTDALILQNAAYEGTGSAPQQAMTAARPGMAAVEDPFEVLKAHYGEGVPYDTEETYYQYWHGYLLLVKPLLLLTDLGGIRILNAIVQLALPGLILWAMGKRGLKRVCLPYLVSILFLAPTVVAKSMQFSACYYLMSFGVLAVLACRDTMEEKAPAIFLWLGIATAFFDYLTYPIAVLGVPAALYCCIRGRMTVPQALKEGMAVCASWCFGYAGMWVSKWVIGSIVTGKNLMAIGAAKLMERSSLDAEQSGSLLYNIRLALGGNIKAFLRTPATLIAVALAVVLLVRILRKLRGEGISCSSALEILFPFLVLACMPLVWYGAASNHSAIHYWFTHKALIVSVFSGLCALETLRGSGE